jgi:hypothetical protein
MTLALEPWWSRDSDRLVMDADGRTLRSADGSNTAHSEHTTPSLVTGRAFSLNAPCGRINDLRLNSYPRAILGSAQLHTQIAAKTQVIARINR